MHFTSSKAEQTYSDSLPKFCVAVVVGILLPYHAIDDVERSSDWRKDRIQDRDVTARSVAPISAR